MPDTQDARIYSALELLMSKYQSASAATDKAWLRSLTPTIIDMPSLAAARRAAKRGSQSAAPPNASPPGVSKYPAANPAGEASPSYTNASRPAWVDQAWSSINPQPEPCLVLHKEHDIVPHLVERLVSIGDFLQAMREQSESLAILPAGKERVPEPAGAVDVQAFDVEIEVLPMPATTYLNDSVMTRYDAYYDVLLSFSFLSERMESEVYAIAEEGAQAFRKRNLRGVKSACVQMYNAEANERAVFDMRQEWLAMKDVSEAIALHDAAASHKHRPVAEFSADVSIALDHLIACVDTVVEVMSECGAQAFAVRDFAKVDHFRHLAVSVICFKQRLGALRESWHQPVLRASNAMVSITSTPGVVSEASAS